MKTFSIMVAAILASVIIIVGLVVAPAVKSVGDKAHHEVSLMNTAEKAGCTVAKIGVDKLKSKGDNGNYTVTGRMTNNCDLPVGAILKLNFIDKAGNIVATSPAGRANIQAHKQFTFEIPVVIPELFATVSADVTSVIAWETAK